jgi:hypothetical protein
MGTLATGCRGCHNDHPYVPYAIESTETGSRAPLAALASAVASVAANAAPFAGEAALVAPPGLTRWPIDGISLDAPAGFVFALALSGDFDGDGRRDAFAIVRPADGGDAGGGDPGRVVFYRGAAAMDSLPVTATFAPPPGLARDPSCTPVTRLVTAGKGAVLAELGGRCSGNVSRMPARWVAVLVGAGPSVRLAATIADPSGTAALTIDADVADRDGDGRDDLALRVAFAPADGTPQPAPLVAATLAWVDRPAGLSRDTAATESSFASLAAWASLHAARSKDAAQVPPYVAQIRALWRATCADGGSPRILAVAGTGAITCGSARALEDAGLADVRAYVTLGDPLRAALALDRASHAPAAHTPSRIAQAQKWIASLAAPASARMLRAVAAVPLAPRVREPSWGPLAFEPSGKLLVQTRAGVVRVDPDQGDEAAANVAAWKPAVTSPDGATHWIEAYDPCDGLPLRATFELGGGSDARDIELPIAPPLGGRCAGARGAPAGTVPIAWGPVGLEALVGGDLVVVSTDLSRAAPLDEFLGQPAAPGAPRSPDGKTYVVATGAGLLVRSPTRTRLLRASELDGTYGDEQGCAVSNDGTHVACVRAGSAWVGTWDAP